MRRILICVCLISSILVLAPTKGFAQNEIDLQNPEEPNQLSGWRYIDNNWYYQLQPGLMLSDETTPDGYTVDSSGVWIPDAKKYWNIDFKEHDIECIEFYNIPVPVAAKMKVITLREDISQIYNAVVNSIVVADDSDLTIGGSCRLVIIKSDGTQVRLGLTSRVITYNGERYSLKNRIPIYELWDQMDYVEIAVSQNELQ